MIPPKIINLKILPGDVFIFRKFNIIQLLRSVPFICHCRTSKCVPSSLDIVILNCVSSNDVGLVFSLAR